MRAGDGAEVEAKDEALEGIDAWEGPFSFVPGGCTFASIKAGRSFDLRAIFAGDDPSSTPVVGVNCRARDLG